MPSRKNWAAMIEAHGATKVVTAGMLGKVSKIGDSACRRRTGGSVEDPASTAPAVRWSAAGVPSSPDAAGPGSIRSFLRMHMWFCAQPACASAWLQSLHAARRCTWSRPAWRRALHRRSTCGHADQTMPRAGQRGPHRCAGRTARAVVRRRPSRSISARDAGSLAAYFNLLS